MVLEIAARNGIMLINHFKHLERYGGEPWGLELVVRGTRESDADPDDRVVERPWPRAAGDRGCTEQGR
jgi:hypothetical protein